MVRSEPATANVAKPLVNKRRWRSMANEDYSDITVDDDNEDQSEDDEEEEGPDFDVARYEVVASGDTFVRYDTFTGVAWILQNPGSPGTARWVAVEEPEEDTDS
jgi:hypothetical protein